MICDAVIIARFLKTEEDEFSSWASFGPFLHLNNTLGKLSELVIWTYTSEELVACVAVVVAEP